MAYQVIRPVKIKNAGDMAGSLTSDILEIINQDNVGLQIVWTGTPTGSFDIQVSNDHVLTQPNGPVSNAGTWTSVTLPSAVSAAGSGSNAFIDLNQLGAAYLRVVYTRVSGTGTLNITATAKAV